MEYKFRDHKKHCWHCNSTKMVHIWAVLDKGSHGDYYLCEKCGATYIIVPELSDKIEICGQLVHNIHEWERKEVREYGPRY